MKKLERNDPSIDDVNLNSFVTPDGEPAKAEDVVRVCQALERNRYVMTLKKNQKIRFSLIKHCMLKKVLEVQMTGLGLENEVANAIAKFVKRTESIKVCFFLFFFFIEF